VCVPPKSVRWCDRASATTSRTIESAILRVKEAARRRSLLFHICEINFTHSQ
jgi:hypothetical protein